MHRGVAVVLFCLTETGALLQAQSPAGQTAPAAQTAPAVQTASALPVYDIATFRLNTTGSGNTNVDTNLTTIRGTNWPLRDILQSAFDVQRDMLYGLPDWARDAHYDVSAKISDPDMKQLDALPREAWGTMLLTLLKDRFQMKWHYETRTLSAYDMVVAKGGMKLTVDPPNPKSSGMSAHDNELTATSVRMDALTKFLAQQLQKPVVDHTDLAGVYSFRLKWTPDRAASAQDKGQDTDAPPSLFTALQEQLGLHLESGKDPVKVVVFDAISPPAEN